MNGGLACSELTYGTGAAASNTAAMSTVQPATLLVGRAADCTAAAGSQVLPYTVRMPAAQAYANNDLTKNGGLTEDQFKRMTRGRTATCLGTQTVVPADTETPTACIGPDVFFKNVVNSGEAGGGPDTPNIEGFGIALCDPKCLLPSQIAKMVD